MAGNKDWLPAKLADQLVMFQNFAAKIGGYQATLGLTAAQITAMTKVCDTWVAAYTYTEQYRSGASGTMGWRDNVFNGPKGGVVTDPPTPPVNAMPAGATTGVLAQFREFRDIILASPSYTEAIGEDLMIVGTGGGAHPSQPTEDLTPDLKCTVGSGYEVSIAGAMHGMDALRVEWQSNGDAAWSLVGFLTKTPGVVHPSPKVPGQPESGRIRARYIHNNDLVGNYSPEYAVTVSA